MKIFGAAGVVAAGLLGSVAARAEGARAEPPAGGATSATGPAGAAGEPASAVPLAGRELKRLLSDRSVEVQVQAIAALRALRDAELTPLFSRMSRGARPALRGPSVLALADLEPSQGLDLLLVRNLDRTTQAAVIAQAVDDGRLPVEQLRDLTRWVELPARLHLSIVARLLTRGERLETGRLLAIAGGEDRVAAACAALLRAQAGEDDPAAGPIEAVLSGAGTATGQQELQAVLRFVRSTRLAGGGAGGAGTFVRRVLERYPDDRLLTYEAVATLLMIDDAATRVGDWWQVQFSRALDEGDRQRLALAALDAAAVRPQAVAASVAERLREDPAGMMRAAGDVLVAMRARDGVAGAGDAALVEAMGRLVGFGQGPTLAWVIEWAKDRPGEPGQSVLALLVEQLAASPNESTGGLVTRAAGALAEQAPGRLAGAVRKAVEDGEARACERILLGLARGAGAGAPALEAVDLVKLSGGRAKAWPSATCEHLATVIRARAGLSEGAASDAGLAASLERVAGGAGQLGPGPRAQAAWLALRLSGEGRPGLARLIADLGG